MAILLVLVAIVFISPMLDNSQSQSANAEDTATVLTYQEQYDLGMKYLTDGNYEEAIIAFTAAIELEPKNADAYEHPFSRRDIIRLGIDMCRALEVCQKHNIIHRDIKPENIFVSENGDFKLGDFGIARTIEKTSGGLSKKGTYHYMAPEVYRGEDYGFSVDTYSLGLVLYRLLNRNRAPFMPAFPEPITYSRREIALAKRITGEVLSKPFYNQGRLPEIMLKACSFNSKERYSSPSQMRQELESIQYGALESEIIYPSGDSLSLV